MIIGLTGTMGSGKSEIAKYLKKKGYEYHVFSDVIREEAKKRNLEPTRKNLQKMGNLLRKEHKHYGVLAKKLLKKIKTDKAVVDGVRNSDEIQELRKSHKFILIARNAPQKIRFDRLKKRGRAGDPKTFEDFKNLDDLENLSEGTGQEIYKCIKMADYEINHTGSIKGLHKKIDEILKEIKFQKNSI